MRLMLPSFESSLPLDPSYVTVVSINDVHLYATLIKAISASMNDIENACGAYFIDEKEKQLGMSKNAELIFDPLLIDFKSRKITNALVSKLKICLNLDVEAQARLEKSLLELQDMVDNLLGDSDIQIKADSEWDSSRIIKALGIELNTGEENRTQLEILSSYLETAGSLSIAGYHIFIGLNQLLNDTELNQFYKEALQKQVSIICLERRDNKPNPSPYARIIYVDEDYEEEVLLPLR